MTDMDTAQSIVCHGMSGCIETVEICLAGKIFMRLAEIQTYQGELPYRG